MDNVEPYAVFYKENKSGLFRYLLRLTGERQLAWDLMQESFTRYLARYGTACANGSLLYAIARNAALDVFRQRGRMRPAESEPASACETPEQHVIQKQSCELLLDALEHLQAADRELLALVVAHELSYRDMGLLLGISTGNVKVRVHRARMALKKILEGKKA
ncbi:MAG: sigma-70 family RNA polymerase sigma factor [Desulfobacterales bacterium]|jgi:RNA polymerase sigma-70 factor (ECF subfamily)